MEARARQTHSIIPKLKIQTEAYTMRRGGESAMCELEDKWIFGNFSIIQSNFSVLSKAALAFATSTSMGQKKLKFRFCYKAASCTDHWLMIAVCSCSNAPNIAIAVVDFSYPSPTLPIHQCTGWGYCWELWQPKWEYNTMSYAAICYDIPDVGNINS